MTRTVLVMLVLAIVLLAALRWVIDGAEACRRALGARGRDT